MTKTYVNVGAAIRWPATENRDSVRGFGTAFELDQNEAEENIKRNVPMIPLTDFEAVGFTAEELAISKTPSLWNEQPEQFHEKLKRCWVRLQEVREELKGA